MARCWRCERATVGDGVWRGREGVCGWRGEGYKAKGYVVRRDASLARAPEYRKNDTRTAHPHAVAHQRRRRSRADAPSRNAVQAALPPPEGVGRGFMGAASSGSRWGKQLGMVSARRDADISRRRVVSRYPATEAIGGTLSNWNNLGTELSSLG